MVEVTVTQRCMNRRPHCFLLLLTCHNHSLFMLSMTYVLSLKFLRPQISWGYSPWPLRRSIILNPVWERHEKTVAKHKVNTYPKLKFHKAVKGVKLPNALNWEEIWGFVVATGKKTGCVSLNSCNIQYNILFILMPRSQPGLQFSFKHMQCICVSGREIVFLFFVATPLSHWIYRTNLLHL